MALAVAPEQAVADATVAQQKDGGQEHQTAYRARFSLQKESDQVQHDEHDVRLHQRRIGGLRYEEHRYQALQAVHDDDDDDGVCRAGAARCVISHCRCC